MKRTTVFLDQGEFMGGAEHFLLDFLDSLSPTERRRLNPVILGGQHPEYQARLAADVRRLDFGLPAVKGGKLAQIVAVCKLVRTARRLKRLLKAEQATQVFTNTPRAHLTVLLLKKVWGWRGDWLVMTHDFTTRPTSVVRAIGKKADIVIANSLPTRQWLRAQLDKTDHEKLRLIENGVDLTPNVMPVTSVEAVINLGRIDPRKGQQYFVEAADLLHERNPDLQFTVVGDSVAQDLATVNYQAEIKQFAADRQLANLHFKPSVTEPLATIAQYDALVFTPTEGETFGRVVIEALSLGKLVLAFNQTGPKEILQEYVRWLQQNKNLETNENPLLVEPNNAMSLAEAVAYFADNPEQVALYTRHAAEFVAEKYSLAETKKRLLEVLLG